MGADLDWRQVSVLRAIGRYLRQGGVTYSQTYLAQALAANVDLARLLISLFETRFDPAPRLDDRPARAARSAELGDKIKTALNDVASLDHDRIIRSYLAVIEAIVRTNAFQPDRSAIALKLLPAQDPRPARAATGVRDLRLLAARRGRPPALRARSPAAGCAGRIAPRTSGPRSSAWSRRRWSRTP